LPIEPPFDDAQALLGALQAEPLAEGELLAPFGARGMTALEALHALGLVAPALPPAERETRRETCSRLNAILLDAALLADRLTALACPVTGGALDANRLELLFLKALEQGENPADFAWGVLEAAGQRVMRDGRPLMTDDRNRAELAERWESFAGRRLPLLRMLGAVR
jgi:hypothetical protein